MLENYGWLLGEAFQLIDDLALEDVDARRRPSPLLVHALPNPTVQRWLEHDKDLSVGQLQQALNDAGSIEWAEERIDGLVTEANLSLETPVSPNLQADAILVLNQMAHTINRKEPE